MPHSPEVVEKQALALELKKAGHTYRSMAKKLDCSSTYAYELMQGALREMIREPAEEVRKIELARLDTMIQALWPAVIGGSDSARRNAVDRVLGIMDRRARLLGLDAPVRRIVEVTTQDEFARLCGELEREIGELEGSGMVEGEAVVA